MNTKSIVYYNYDVDAKQFENQTTSNYCFFEYREIDIVTSKKVNKEFFKPDDILDYTISLSNQGTYKATKLVITDLLPEQALLGLVNIYSYIEHNFNYKTVDDKLIIELDFLNEKETVHICYSAKVNNLLEINKNLITKVVGTSDEDYSFTSNELTIFQKYARVLCNKKMSSIIYPNRDFETTITITNVGNEVANNINVFDQFLDKFVLKKILIDNEEIVSYSLDQSRLKIKIDNLEPNITKTISIYGLLKK